MNRVVRRQHTVRRRFTRNAREVCSGDERAVGSENRWKAYTIIAAVLGVLIGRGGVPGIVSWVSEKPMQERTSSVGLLVESHEALINSTNRLIVMLEAEGETATVVELRGLTKRRERFFQDSVDRLMGLDARYRAGVLSKENRLIHERELYKDMDEDIQRVIEKAKEITPDLNWG